MIIVSLMGGLGNQLFQYAAGIALASARNVELAVDASWLSHAGQEWTYREYQLSNFACRPPTVDPADHEHVETFQEEDAFRFDPSLFNAPSETKLVGYFQSEKYFIRIADRLRADLTFISEPQPSDAELVDTISSSTSVAMHVRRGDYVTADEGNYDVCDRGYFRRAASTMAGRVRNPHFFVFTDDPDWVDENVRLGHPTTLVGGKGDRTAVQDLQLMTLCEHTVISNSTFGWWGAWLNPNPTKVVVGPTQWLRDRHRNTRGVMPDGWIRVAPDWEIRGD